MVSLTKELIALKQIHANFERDRNLMKIDSEQLREIIIRLKDELVCIIGKKGALTSSGEKLNVLYEMEFEKKALVANQVSDLATKTQAIIDKISQTKKDNILELQYNLSVIKNNRMIQQNSDKRQEMKEKAAVIGKNTHEDVQELTKRRQMCLLLMYNRFVTRQMDLVLEENKEMEYNFEILMSFAPNMDISQVTNKISVHDKVYNARSLEVAKKKEIVRQTKFEIEQLIVQERRQRLTNRREDLTDDGEFEELVCI